MKCFLPNVETTTGEVFCVYVCMCVGMCIVQDESRGFNIWSGDTTVQVYNETGRETETSSNMI